MREVLRILHVLRAPVGGLFRHVIDLAAAQEKTNPGLPSRAYPFEDLPVKENGQNKGRAVLNGLTHTGFRVELHLTELGPGMAPHAPRG